MESFSLINVGLIIVDDEIDAPFGEKFVDGRFPFCEVRACRVFETNDRGRGGLMTIAFEARKNLEIWREFKDQAFLRRKLSGREIFQILRPAPNAGDVKIADGCGMNNADIIRLADKLLQLFMQILKVSESELPTGARWSCC